MANNADQCRLLLVCTGRKGRFLSYPSDINQKGYLLLRAMDWQKVEVRDEDGNGFEFIKNDGLVMPSVFLGPHQDTRLKLVKDFKYSRDDILICSYPKTGTHWVFNLVYFLTADGPLDEMVTVSPKLLELAPAAKWEMLVKSPLRSSHFTPDRLPTDLINNGGKVIVVKRNPKDACVSLLHHLSKTKAEMKFGNKISWKRYLDAWINGELPFGTYFDYYNAWGKEIKSNRNIDVLIVHFENLKSDCLKELQRIQEFLGLDRSHERLQQIVDKCTLQNMRSDVESGKLQTTLVDEDGNSILYRKGEVGDWKNYFTVAQSEQMDKLVEEKLKDSMFMA